MSAWRSALVVLVTTFLSSCATPIAPSAPSPTTSERFGAPLIQRPLDVSAIYAEPCRQLSEGELEELAIEEPGRPRSYLGDSECRWPSRRGDSLLLSVDSDRDLLLDTYRARIYPIFEPSTVSNYPAVREMPSRAGNSCIVTVGLGPKQALRSDWTGLGTFEPGDPDPCERAETAAAMVIRKLPPQR